MMQKADLEVARESFISAKQAQQRLQQMFTFSRDSLAYVKDIVLFMKFDVGEQIQGSPTQKEVTEPEVELPKRPQDEAEVHDQRDTPKSLEAKPLEYFFTRNIPEIAEVTLSVLFELYEEGNTKTPLDIVHLYAYLQSKTDKSVVQDLYNRFFAQNRIHFTQYLKRTFNRNATLEREKAEMRRKLDEQAKAITDMQKSFQRQLTRLQTRGPESDLSRGHTVEVPMSPAIQQEVSSPQQVQPEPEEHAFKTLPAELVRDKLQRFQENKVIEA